GPIINLVVMSSTYVAFSGPDSLGQGMVYVVLRVGLGFIVAVVASLVVDWQYRIHGPALVTTRTLEGTTAGAEESDKEEKKTVWQRVSSITETALHDFVDITVFLILGAVLASVSRVWIVGTSEVARTEMAPPVAILVMMGLAVLLCLC